MWYSISNLVFLFFIYSFIGWLWETVYCSLKDKQFVYRGFLAGPYCPVYGFAVTTVLFLTKPFQENLPILFFGGLIIAPALASHECFAFNGKSIRPLIFPDSWL
jgi:uncharacterized membrane protein